ncbi:MotA/TolQ/ExbB proton channel family protein [uncultured Ruegeria sp.]|uniref:MotA/TolQ/ExbB proton channel family protein n=1 Tax=uncultured Ruegeria sp. TaxID=259304 RepID=UPI002605D7E9|nr:MotA/TolQ/ExbB proton channel family protein [uncultured Ruegeria sp.]
MGFNALVDFLTKGGPALWAIAVLSVLTVAVGLWRVSGLSLAGVWSRKLGARPSDRVAKVAEDALRNQDFDGEMALNEVTRIAKREVSEMRRGIRALELIAAIAPLIGLLGTVLGMIRAFQALQEAGSAVDPSILAGGIWEALLTTAAGMAVAIPASVLVSWFESIAEQEQARMEDRAVQVFNATPIHRSDRHPEAA